MSVPLRHLESLYEQNDDPWDFRTSPYEKARFDAVRSALLPRQFNAVFELGCGNGELARRIAPLTKSYTGLDAVPAALELARRAVPQGRFMQGYYPCELPDGEFDLIILSEVLYFLDAAGIKRLASEIAQNWPDADVLCVNWLGPTANELQGTEALDRLRDAMPSYQFTCITHHPRFRIDHARPRAAS